MPGHMNVLLAEANVPYEQLLEMEPVNGQFPRTDVALVVGANDVVNPAARTSPGSPIYGMPILDADNAKSVVFLKRSMRPGFAGIENELLYDAADHAGLRRRQGHAHQDRRRAQAERCGHGGLDQSSPCHVARCRGSNQRRSAALTHRPRCRA